MNNTRERLFLQMALTLWQTYSNRVDKVFNLLTPEKYVSTVAPGSNTAAWILAHLTSVNDNLHTLFGFCDPLFPALTEALNSKSKPIHEAIPYSELFNMWKQINTNLNDRFLIMSIEEWFDKHTTISFEDFQNEPHRNKLNVLLSRTAHLNHHLGQLALIK